MPTCRKCGTEHDLLDPTFRRPEAYVQLDSKSRAAYAKANDDLCQIFLPDADELCFVRGTLPVEVVGHPDGIWWGLWADVSASAFSRVLEMWSDPDQASEPPFAGTLANLVPSYPDTIGLPLSVQLTGPTSRPEFRFAGENDHPFVQECRSGVELHRASEWVDLITGSN